MVDLFTVENISALFTLSFLEIVLGIDNLVFISILVDKVEKSKQELARKIGLTLALGTRIGLLFCISFIMRLTDPLFTILSHSFSGRDLILLAGGLFLIGKATFEIHEKVELHETPHKKENSKKAKFMNTVIQIAILDIVFSLDSVITAIGMSQNLNIMIAAIVLAMIVMIASAKSIAAFINKHPTFKILALSFLLLIGVVLVAEAFHQHVSKGYIYSAIGFSLFVESINIRVRRSETNT
ncbi:MAG: TerC family protein [Ignavibacteria bacterium]|nr:TerC family protein [Ignavibacteria bacterium]